MVVPGCTGWLDLQEAVAHLRRVRDDPLYFSLRKQIHENLS